MELVASSRTEEPLAMDGERLAQAPDRVYTVHQGPGSLMEPAAGKTIGRRKRKQVLLLLYPATAARVRTLKRRGPLRGSGGGQSIR